MRSHKIIEKMEQLVNPILVRLGQFDEETLYVKCSMWENMRRLTTSSIQHEIMNAIDDETVNAIADGQVDLLPDSKKIDSMVKTMVSGAVEDMMHDPIKKVTWDHVNRYTYDSIKDAVEYSAHNSVSSSLYVHVFSKFTPDEFSSVLKPMNDVKKERMMDIHAQFKKLDWLWEHGLCCFKGFFKGEFFVCSYNDPKFFRQIKGVVSFE